MVILETSGIHWILLESAAQFRSNLNPAVQTHSVDVPLQVAAVDNSRCFQIGLGLLDVLNQQFPPTHALSFERYFSHLAKQKIV